MAQAGQRPFHTRKPSRLARLTSSDLESNYEHHADQTTIDYINKILCPDPMQKVAGESVLADPISTHSLDKSLPPLTSSNAVDVQLYAIIAVIISQFVQSWYNKITPDSDFSAEVVQTIARCTRGLEVRLRTLDLIEVLLDDLPGLLQAHLEVVIIAKKAGLRSDSYLNAARQIYHDVRPHNALPSPQIETASLEQPDTSESAWSQLLVARILPLVLPPEDLANPCLHVLVSEVLAEMMIRNALCEKASQSWLVWEGISKSLNVLRPGPTLHSSNSNQPPSVSRLERYGLTSDHTVLNRTSHSASPADMLQRLSQSLGTFLQAIAWTFAAARLAAMAMMRASSVPARSLYSSESNVDTQLDATGIVHSIDPNDPTVASHHIRPILTMRAWTCVSTLSGIEQRMPWLVGIISLLRWAAIHALGRLGAANGILDRLMAAQITDLLCRPDLLPSVLQAIRGALFPNNALAAARQPPTAAEMAMIKRECAENIIQSIPAGIRSVFFATKDQDLMRQDVEDTLDLFSDSYMNKHFIVSAVELLVVRLFPELADDSRED